MIERFESYMTSNCYVIVPNSHDSICYIIDLPPDHNLAIEYIYKNNLSVGGVFLTHGHYDHTLGLSTYTENNIYMNLDDEFLARNPKEQINSLIMSSELEIDNYEGELNDIFSLSIEPLQVLKNPGHTKGSISFEFNNLGAVFTGDFVFAEGIGRTDLFSGSATDMRASINDVFLNLNKEYEVFPGHGKSDSVKNILKYNNYLWEFIND